jgi:hypothetical protein
MQLNISFVSKVERSSLWTVSFWWNLWLE